MKEKIVVVALVSVFSFYFMVANAYAGAPMSKRSDTAYLVSGLTGAEVKNNQGEDLGRIRDFVIDSKGRIAFAILHHVVFWHAFEPDAVEKPVAVPFSALSSGEGRDHLVLNISKERLASAPSFDINNLDNRELAEDVYRYFGLQPYWTDEEREENMNSDQDPFDLVGKGESIPDIQPEM